MTETHHQKDQQKPNDRVSSRPVNHNQPHVNCPRCGSDETKFCYYNNYSFLQPRYLCKSCKRYWTHGGALRDVPVGGCCRKRSKLSLSSSSSGKDYSITQPSNPNANLGITDPGYDAGNSSYEIIEELSNLANPGAQEQMMQHQQPPPPPKEEFYKMGNESFVAGNEELGDWLEIFINNSGATDSPSGSGLDPK